MALISTEIVYKHFNCFFKACAAVTEASFRRGKCKNNCHFPLCTLYYSEILAGKELSATIFQFLN